MQAVADIDMSNFRENLAYLCAERGSRKQLAERAGISREYFQEVLAGRKSPGLDVAYNIAEAIGVGLDLLKLPHKKFLKILKNAG